MEKDIINNLLAESEDFINVLVEDVIAKFETPATRFIRESVKLQLTIDLIISFEKYTLPSDKLESFKLMQGDSGSLEISAIISRDGIPYDYDTEVIYAGGVNIQKLHYRYITHTKLPKTGFERLSRGYKTKLSELEKKVKTQEDIAKTEKVRQSYINTIEKLEAETPENLKNKFLSNWQLRNSYDEYVKQVHFDAREVYWAKTGEFIPIKNKTDWEKVYDIMFPVEYEKWLTRRNRDLKINKDGLKDAEKRLKKLQNN